MKPFIPLLLKPSLTAAPSPLTLLNNIFTVNPQPLTHIRLNAFNRRWLWLYQCYDVLMLLLTLWRHFACLGSGSFDSKCIIVSLSSLDDLVLE